MKIFSLTFCMAFIFFISPPGMAECYDSATGNPFTPTQINIDTPKDVYIGIDYITTEVRGQNVIQWVPPHVPAVTCDNRWRVLIKPGIYPPVGNKGFMDTNVKSVLISVEAIVVGKPLNFTSNMTQWVDPTNDVNISMLQFNMEKKAPTSKGDGIISAGTVATMQVEEEGGITYELAIININPITVHAGSCIVSQSPVQVNLGTYSPQFFTGVGTVTPIQDFVIGLSCDPLLSVYAQFDGLDTSPATEGVFGLSGSGQVATGIGVRIYESGTSDIMKNGVSDLIFNSTPDGHPTLQARFRAQYYQYKSMVTPGDANASVTYTMTYD